VVLSGLDLEIVVATDEAGIKREAMSSRATDSVIGRLRVINRKKLVSGMAGRHQEPSGQ
jgi:hypothetical protein